MAKSKKKPAAESRRPVVRVRMFRQGLGDCFLVTFDVDGRQRHMLIDCGTLGNKSTQVRIDNVAEHILEAIEPEGRLDIVVATHEHQDHLSGFRNKTLQQLKGKVDHVWLAWTENPQDPDAQKLAKNKHDLGVALAAVAQAEPSTDVGMQVHDLLGFAGDPSAGPLGFAATVDEAMDFVRTELGAKVSYFNPGDLIEENWLSGFRIYVLGPPRSKQALSLLGEHQSDGLYGLQKAAELRTAVSVDDERSPEKIAEFELEQPFDRQFAWQDTASKQQYYPGYCDEREGWRSIENDWLSVASNLALQLDSVTNNTSLALAIERVADGRVLLFPADAQLGSWLSWHDPAMVWNVTDPAGKTRKVTAADLLARTVFYKVGHHASHNATAREKGLELMVRQNELTAFIPVDRAVALTRNPQGSWQMPAVPLYLNLLDKCQGRVARSDLGWAAKPIPKQKSETEFADLASAKQWKAWEKSQQSAKHRDNR